MPPRIIPVSPDDPREDRVETAAEALRDGEVVVVPTETFYGMAVDAHDTSALRKLNRLKRKPDDSPILLLAADTGQVRRTAGELPGTFEKLAETFWPGPLTLVLPAAAGLPPEISGGMGTVGIRVPGLQLPRLLAACLQRPISGVSANLHGRPPIRKAAEVVDIFPEGIGIVMDCGPTAGGAPSTVIDLTGPEPRILRKGIIPVKSLRPFLPGLQE